jgi:hypothetical protein
MENDDSGIAVKTLSACILIPLVSISVRHFTVIVIAHSASANPLVPSYVCKGS